MSILKMKEVKQMIKLGKKQSSKEFLAFLDDSIKRKINSLITNAPNKRLKEKDVIL